MALFFTREETSDQITIRYTSTWLYLLIVGLGAMIVVSTVRMPFNIDAVKQGIFLFYVVMFGVYYIATFKTRKEIFRAIRDRRIRLSGSRFNPKRPLTIIIDKLARDEPSEHNG